MEGVREYEPDVDGSPMPARFTNHEQLIVKSALLLLAEADGRVLSSVIPGYGSMNGDQRDAVRKQIRTLWPLVQEALR